MDVEVTADVPGKVQATSLQDAGEGHLDTGLPECQGTSGNVGAEAKTGENQRKNFSEAMRDMMEEMEVFKEMKGTEAEMEKMKEAVEELSKDFESQRVIRSMLKPEEARSIEEATKEAILDALEEFGGIKANERKFIEFETKKIVIETKSKVPNLKAEIAAAKCNKNHIKLLKNNLKYLDEMEEDPDYVKLKIVYDKARIRIQRRLKDDPKYRTKLETPKVAFLWSEILRRDDVQCTVKLLQTGSLVEPLEQGWVPSLTYDLGDGNRREIGGKSLREGSTAEDLGLAGSVCLVWSSRAWDCALDSVRPMASLWPSREVAVRLSWPSDTVVPHTCRASGLRCGEVWRSYPAERSLDHLEMQVRQLLNCQDPARRLHLSLQSGEDRERHGFYGESSLAQLVGKSKEVTVHCSPLAPDSPQWAGHRPSGEAGLQYYRDDTVELVVDGRDGVSGSGQLALPWKYRWPKDQSLELLCNFLRNQLQPRDAKERLLFYLKDKKLPMGWSYCYDFLSPKQMRISSSTTLKYVALRPDSKTGDGRRSFPGLLAEGSERFGLETFTKHHEALVSSHWRTVWVQLGEEVACSLPTSMSSKGLSVGYCQDRSLQDLDSFLRRNFRCRKPEQRLFLQLKRDSHCEASNFLALGPHKDSAGRIFRGQGLLVGGRGVEDPCWAQLREEGGWRGGQDYLDYFKAAVLAFYGDPRQETRTRLSPCSLITVTVERKTGLTKLLDDQATFPLVQKLLPNMLLGKLLERLSLLVEPVSKSDSLVLTLEGGEGGKGGLLVSQWSWYSLEGAGVKDGALLTLHAFPKQVVETAVKRRLPGCLASILEQDSSYREEQATDWEEKWSREKMVGEEKKMLVIDVTDKAVLEKRRLKEEIEKKVHLARMTQLEKTEANIKVLEAKRKESLSCIKGIKEERRKLMKERAALAKEKVQLEEDKVILEEQTARLKIEVKLKENSSILEMEEAAIEEEIFEPSSKRIKTAFLEEKTSELAAAIEKFDLTEEATEAEVLVSVLPPDSFVCWQGESQEEAEGAWLARNSLQEEQVQRQRERVRRVRYLEYCCLQGRARRASVQARDLEVSLAEQCAA